MDKSVDGSVNESVDKSVEERAEEEDEESRSQEQKGMRLRNPEPEADEDRGQESGGSSVSAPEVKQRTLGRNAVKDGRVWEWSRYDSEAEHGLSGRKGT